MTTEQRARRYVQSLEPEEIERLGELLNEITDIIIGLDRLLKAGDLQECPSAFNELQFAADSRLCKVLDIVGASKEEG